MDHGLGRIRAGDQVGGADDIEIFRPCQPFAPGDDLVFPHRDMGDRPAECLHTHAEEQPRQIAEAGSACDD